jgi:hypothetical protein
LCLHICSKIYVYTFFKNHFGPKIKTPNNEDEIPRIAFGCYNSKIIRNLIILFLLFKFGKKVFANIFFPNFSNSLKFFIRVFQQKGEKIGVGEGLKRIC